MKIIKKKWLQSWILAVSFSAGALLWIKLLRKFCRRGGRQLAILGFPAIKCSLVSADRDKLTTPSIRLVGAAPCIALISPEWKITCHEVGSVDVLAVRGPFKKAMNERKRDARGRRNAAIVAPPSSNH